jgi:hypothetical protein
MSVPMDSELEPLGPFSALDWEVKRNRGRGDEELFVRTAGDSTAGRTSLGR